MSIVSIAPGHSLERSAAASYARCILAGMPAGGLNSSYRPTSLQRAIFLARYQTTKVAYARVLGVPRYDRLVYNGRAYYRKPGMAMAAVPGTSIHEQGRALDIATASAAWAWMNKHGKRRGWRRSVRSEKWHWEYFPAKDKYLNAPAPVTALQPQEDLMATVIIASEDSKKDARTFLFNADNGLCRLISGAAYYGFVALPKMEFKRLPQAHFEAVIATSEAMREQLSPPVDVTTVPGAGSPTITVEVAASRQEV